MEKNRKLRRSTKKSPLLTSVKIVQTGMTIIFSLFMVIMTGAGLIYNSQSYGGEIRSVGIFFIVSAALMGAGELLMWLRKNLTSAGFTIGGTALCMAMLYRLKCHADASGWSDKYTLEPISNMYMSRILPVIPVTAVGLVIVGVQYLSYEETEKRRAKRRARESEKNAPSPPIV